MKGVSTWATENLRPSFSRLLLHDSSPPTYEKSTFKPSNELFIWINQYPLPVLKIQPMASSPSQTTSSTRIELFTAADLSARPAFLHILVELVNLAFSGKDGFPVPRFLSDNELIESLGKEGLCAVMFDGATDEPIATASTKLWGTSLVRQNEMILKNAIAALFYKNNSGR